jgi:tetrahydromethanopterin S-methyltransferase subunit H
MMLKFEREQKIFEIGRNYIEGQPGELATALIGTIFYEGHRIVEDAERGVFDRSKTEELIKRQEELSEKTGNPHMIDVVGSTPVAIQRYIEFVAAVTEAPILIDSTFTDAKMAGVKYAAEIGILDRIVYNSITYHIDGEEVEALKNAGVKSAVILGYNPKNVRPVGRLELLRGNSTNEGLLQITEKAGINNILVDTVGSRCAKHRMGG